MTPEPLPRNGMATSGLVVGGIGILFLGALLGPVGLVLSLIGLKRSARVGSGRGLAIAGILTSSVATVVGLIELVLLFMWAVAVPP